MSRRAVVFRHYPGEDLSTFAPILESCGYAYQYINTPEEKISDSEVMEADILIIMGGPMGAYETDDHPYLREEIRLARARLDLDKPVLGVCLGAQIMANALGAKVYKGGKGKEIGWYPIFLTDAGKKSALAHLSPEKTSMFHWHGDTFDLPEGAVLLASSEMYPHQAFRFGKNSLAMQFHPEVSEIQITGTFEGFTDDLKEFGDVAAKIETLNRDSRANAGILAQQNGLFLREWLHGLSYA